MNHPDSAAAYVASVVTLYLEMPDTPIRVSASDQWLARHFHQDGLPLETIETALLLGSLRRLIRHADAPRLAPIRSLAYFRPVIEELLDNPAPANYRDYLRLKLRQALKAGPAVDQKTTFSDER
ncbi:MAG: hypothetical protein WCA44_11045 [Acidobacteriaceae bacterium]